MEEGEVGGKRSWSNQYSFFQESFRERKWDRKKKEKILMTVHKVNQISCQDFACANLYHKLPFIIFGFFYESCKS